MTKTSDSDAVGEIRLKSAEEAMRSVLGLKPRAVMAAETAVPNQSQTTDGWRPTNELRLFQLPHGATVLQQRWMQDGSWSHAWRDVPTINWADR